MERDYATCVNTQRTSNREGVQKKQEHLVSFGALHSKLVCRGGPARFTQTMHSRCMPTCRTPNWPAVPRGADPCSHCRTTPAKAELETSKG